MAVGSVASSGKYRGQTRVYGSRVTAGCALHEGRYEGSREKRECHTFARRHSIVAPETSEDPPPSSAPFAILASASINCG